MNKIKILIVDDDKFISEMYATKFKADGYDVDAAYDAKEAIEKIKTWEPDAVLLDLAMYPIDGFGVLEKMGEFRLNKIPKIIVLTNINQKGDFERAMSLGAADYIVKANSTPSEVVAHVKQLLKS